MSADATEKPTPKPDNRTQLFISFKRVHNVIGILAEAVFPNWFNVFGTLSVFKFSFLIIESLISLLA